MKSSDNVVRYNTLRDSRGSIVLRHGNRNRVDGNLMLGNTAGIRFYDNDHVVVNNLIQGGNGQSTGPRLRRCRSPAPVRGRTGRPCRYRSR